MPIELGHSVKRDANGSPTAPNRSLNSWRTAAAAVGVSLLCVMADSAAADTFVPCTASTCTWSIAVGGTTVESGTYGNNSNTGALSLNPITWAANGATASLSLNGNTDPVLGFNFSAATAAAGNTFSLTLSMPVTLSGPIAASSSVSYSLTADSSAGAEVQPLFGHTVTAQEVSTVVGGPSPVNTGVDVGNTFFVTGGPVTQNSPIYTTANLYTLDSGNQYDLMSVTVAFSLSAASNVGLSGFVEQSPVPLPASAWLLMSGAVGVWGLFPRRQRRQLALTRIAGL